MKKWIFSVAFLALCITMLQSCSTAHTPQNDDAVVKDILQNDSFYSDYGLVVTDYNITSHLTSTERMTDEIEIQVFADCNDFSYSCKYGLSYLLYDNGWILDSFRSEKRSWEAKNYDFISQEAVDNKVNDLGFDSYSLSYIDQTINHVGYYYITNVVRNYISTDYEVCLSYDFSPSQGWAISNFDINAIDMYPDMIGIWKSTDHDMDLTLNILSMERVGENDYLLTATYRYLNACYDIGYEYTRGHYESRTDYIQQEPITMRMNYFNEATWYLEGANDYVVNGWVYLGDIHELYSWDSNEHFSGIGITTKLSYGTFLTKEMPQ